MTDDTLTRILSEPILPPCQTHRETQTFLLKRIPQFRLPDHLETWEAEAEQLRRRVLDEVILRGVPESWHTTTPDVIWGDAVETGKGYILRKLRYQALPGLWIPTILYEPTELQGKVPAVLNVNGHVGPPGKAIDYKQLRCINLSKRGIIALNPEWFYFGELHGEGYRHNRAAYLDLCGIAGVAVFFLSMQRGLDVLLSHDHTDPERVAVTGLSGGGWQTIILSALDTRVRLAVPNAGYIGLDVRVEHQRDIGDIEQNPTDLVTIADYPTLTAMLAPRPALLIYNQMDDCCFQTERARPSVYEPVRPLYEALGHADDFQFHNNVDPGTHNYDVDNRQQFYRFLNRHFLPEEVRVDDEIPSNDETRTAEELTAGVPPGNADFVTLSMEASRTLPRTTWPEGDLNAVKTWQEEGRARLCGILRYRPQELSASVVGEASDNGRRVVSYTLSIGNEWTLPALMVCETPAPRGVVVVTADGGRTAAAPIVADALGRGMRVVIVDLLFNGECQTSETPIHQFAMMLSAGGERPLGIQMAQLVAVSRWAAGIGGEEVTLIGAGGVSSLIALTAAAAGDAPVGRVVLVEAFPSLKLLIENQARYEDYPSPFCFGLLEAFDIRELIGLIAPRPVDLVRPYGDPARVEAELCPLREFYARFGGTEFKLSQENP
jgi:dienelactone hydrolase